MTPELAPVIDRWLAARLEGRSDSSGERDAPTVPNRARCALGCLLRPQAGLGLRVLRARREAEKPEIDKIEGRLGG